MQHATILNTKPTANFQSFVACLQLLAALLYLICVQSRSSTAKTPLLQEFPLQPPCNVELLLLLANQACGKACCSSQRSRCPQGAQRSVDIERGRQR